ncbi:MAG: hypothetical protein HRT67_06325, partial [Flavobacteriaceae bacterium]|nr:hypothetical protein [Flavobacteriaceae bacterium]
MKVVKLYILLWALSFSNIWSQADQNHIKKITYKVPLGVSETSQVLSDDKIETIQYFDGIGRPLQNVAINASPSGSNMVTYIGYNKNNIVDKQYLPYISNNSNYDPEGLTRTTNFYNTSYHANTLNPYSETVYEKSPLRRVLYRAAPGEDWKYDKNDVLYENAVTENIDIDPYGISEYIGLTSTAEIEAVFQSEIPVFDMNHDCNSPPVIIDPFAPQYQAIDNFNVCFSNGFLNFSLYFSNEINNQGKTIPKRIKGSVIYPLDFECPDTDLGYLLDLNENQTNFKVDVINNTLVINNPNGDECVNGIATHLSFDYNLSQINVLSYDSALQQGNLIRFDYQGNAFNEVNKFSVFHPNDNTEVTELVFDGYYDSNELYKTITKDENWQPNQTFLNDHTTEEFKDKQGRVILKRTYNDGIAHDTQYVYDDFGNLTYVLSPKGSDLVLLKVSLIGNTTPFNYSDLRNSYLRSFNGSGGGFVNVSPGANQITVNFNFSFNGIYHLRQGPIAMVNSNIPNMDIGTISGAGYSYDISIEEGYLHIAGSGLVQSINETLIADIPEYYIDEAALDDLCYIYHYDYRNRLIEKKIPGKGWEYIIYDKLDRPVLTQEANLRAYNYWLFTKYDAFGRVVYTGKLSNSVDDRVAFQERVNNQTVLYETSTTNVNTSISGHEMYYTNNAMQFQESAISYSDLYTINYYDSYNPHVTAVAANPGMVYDHNVTTQTKTLATGSRVQILDNTGNHWITSVSYYDDKARPIYAASHNSLLGSRDYIKTELDFTGKVLQTESTHVKSNSTLVTHDAFTYDHASRLLSQVQTINGGTPELIVNNHYDELGQLVSKNVGGTVSTNPVESDGLQTIDYTYNIRGWLKTINDLDTMGDDLFGFKLNYNTTELTDSEALYNGNISETIWRTSNDIAANVSEHGYSYKYDALNRITSAAIVNDGASEFDNAFDLQYTNYDKNGNLLSLGRSGWDDTTSTLLTNMDALIYKYNGNQLTEIIDNGNTNYGFKSAMSDYKYDANGNMGYDSGKGITVAYNHLNLPNHVTASQGNIAYIYDATGVKLQKIVTEGNSQTITSYAGNYVYKQDNTGEYLQFFNHAEGYVEPSGNSFNYIYQYKDHLGNIRLSYDLNEDNSVIINEDYSGVTEDYSWTGGSNVGHDVINGQLHFSALNKWEKISKYIDFVPNKTVHIEFDFEKGNMERPILFIKEKINGVWESNADRDM